MKRNATIQVEGPDRGQHRQQHPSRLRQRAHQPGQQDGQEKVGSKRRVEDRQLSSECLQLAKAAWAD